MTASNLTGRLRPCEETAEKSSYTRVQVIEVIINGKAEQIPAQHTVSTLLQHLRIASDRVAVELNRNIVRKRDWSDTPVPSGAQLEIVEFVGGG